MKLNIIIGLLTLILFFSGVGQEFMLLGTAKNGQVVGTVIASDPDNVNHPNKQTLKFSIVSGNTNTAFKIASLTGVLTVNNATYINSRTKKYFDLVIKVTDNGVPVQSAQATIRVTTQL